MITDFKGKTAVITGAGSGIGKALALVFAEKGANLAICDIQADVLKRASDEIRCLNVDVLSQVLDVSQYEQVADFADATFERFGAVHILCNNAGIGGGGPIRLLEMADWDLVLGVNLFGVIHGIKAFYPRMMDSKEPCHIVNTGSVAGLLPGSMTPYSTSKAAVVSLSEALLGECQNGAVGVSVLCPGFVKTQIANNEVSLREGKDALFQLPDEMAEAASAGYDAMQKLLAEGMDTKELAEKVILAIENDIFYILTHPEFIPLMSGRVEMISEDAERLKVLYQARYPGSRDDSEKAPKKATYQNASPSFTLTYPQKFVEMTPGKAFPNCVFTAVDDPVADLNIFVSPNGDPDLPPDYSLETATKYLAEILNYVGRDATILSDKVYELSDGSTVRKGRCVYRSKGTTKVNVMALFAQKDDFWISIVVGVVAGVPADKYVPVLDSFQWN